MSGFFRMREASSAKATSRTWWLPFSMRQCPRIHSFQHSGGTPAAEDTQKTISLVVCRVRSWDRACRRCARETDRGAPSPGDGKVRIGRRLCIGARPLTCPFAPFAEAVRNVRSTSTPAVRCACFGEGTSANRQDKSLPPFHGGCAICHPNRTVLLDSGVGRPPPNPALASAETWSAQVTRATRPDEVSL